MSTLTRRPLQVDHAFDDQLRALYATPPRAYHAYTHILDVLAHFDAALAGPGFEHPGEVHAAILLHDVIYLPGAKDNEAQSAALVPSLLAARYPTLDLTLVSDLILLTARHGKLDTATLTHDAALFLDCDMAILGASPPAYDAYAAAIREEHSATPSLLYTAGRTRFLNAVLDAPRIFHSDFFHARLAAAAKDNLRRELAALRL